MKYRILTFEEFCEKTKSKEVKHSVDTSGNFPSWIDYWEKETSLSRDIIKKCPCCEEPVSPEDLVGAHVEDEDSNQYITPTCNHCNNTYKEGNADKKWFPVNQDYLCQLPQQTQER